MEEKSNFWKELKIIINDLFNDEWGGDSKPLTAVSLNSHTIPTVDSIVSIYRLYELYISSFGIIDPSFLKLFPMNA